MGLNALGVLLLTVSLLQAQENPGASPFKPPPEKFGGANKDSLTDAFEDAHNYAMELYGWSIQRQNLVNSDFKATGSAFAPSEFKGPGNLGEGPQRTVINTFKKQIGKDISDAQVARKLTPEDAKVVLEHLGFWRKQADGEAKELYETSQTFLTKNRRHTALVNNYKSENANEINKLADELAGLREKYETKTKSLATALDLIRATDAFVTAWEMPIRRQYQKLAKTLTELETELKFGKAPQNKPLHEYVIMAAFPGLAKAHFQKQAAQQVTTKKYSQWAFRSYDLRDRVRHKEVHVEWIPEPELLPSTLDGLPSAMQPTNFEAKHLPKTAKSSILDAPGFEITGILTSPRYFPGASGSKEFTSIAYTSYVWMSGNLIVQVTAEVDTSHQRLPGATEPGVPANEISKAKSDAFDLALRVQRKLEESGVNKMR